MVLHYLGFLILIYCSHFLFLLLLSHQADNIVNVVDMNNTPLVISHRLSPATMPPMEKVMPSHLALQEILIVGNCSDQVGEEERGRGH